jgi:hypothetical protein
MGMARMTAGAREEGNSPAQIEDAARAAAFLGPILYLDSHAADVRFLGYAWQGENTTDVKATSIYVDSDRQTLYAEISTWINSPRGSRPDETLALKFAALEFIAVHDASRHYDGSPKMFRELEEEVQQLPRTAVTLRVDGQPIEATSVLWESLSIYVCTLQDATISIGFVGDATTEKFVSKRG